MELKFVHFNKIIILAIALLNIPAFVMGQEQEKGPIYLYIKNNTNLSFDLIEQQEPLSYYSPTIVFNTTVKAGEFKKLEQLPAALSSEYNETSYFGFKIGEKLLAQLIFVTEPQNSTTEARARLSLKQPNKKWKILPSTDSTTTYPENEFHIFIQLNGNKENGFADSSIKVEIKTPEMKLRTGRLQERLQHKPEEQSIEQLLKMKRQ